MVPRNKTVKRSIVTKPILKEVLNPKSILKNPNQEEPDTTSSAMPKKKVAFKDPMTEVFKAKTKKKVQNIKNWMYVSICKNPQTNKSSILTNEVGSF